MRHFMLLAPIFLLLTGCFARGGISGDTSANLDATVVAIHEAALTTLTLNGLSIEKKGADVSSALIRGRYADNTPVTIHVQQLTSNASTMTIQVGTFGDEKRSQVILEGITQQLGL